jgi:hypothetical protein
LLLDLPPRKRSRIMLYILANSIELVRNGAIVKMIYTKESKNKVPAIILSSSTKIQIY